MYSVESLTANEGAFGAVTVSADMVRLADDSPGFGNPAKPWSAVRLWAHDPEGREDVPSAYDMQFRGIDIVIGRGNPGAVGVHLHGAQGCTVQDVKVSGRGPFHAGLQHLIGSGGGVQNLEVIGGKHAILNCLPAGNDVPAEAQEAADNEGEQYT